jgi:hypothetical protein
MIPSAQPSRWRRCPWSLFPEDDRSGFAFTSGIKISMITNFFQAIVSADNSNKKCECTIIYQGKCNDLSFYGKKRLESLSRIAAI